MKKEKSLLFNLKFHYLKMAYNFNRQGLECRLLVQNNKSDFFISSFTNTLRSFYSQCPSLDYVTYTRANNCLTLPGMKFFFKSQQKKERKIYFLYKKTHPNLKRGNWKELWVRVSERFGSSESQSQFFIGKLGLFAHFVLFAIFFLVFMRNDDFTGNIRRNIFDISETPRFGKVQVFL